MELQALRYAAMISVMTFDELVSTDAPTQGPARRRSDSYWGAETGESASYSPCSACGLFGWEDVRLRLSCRFARCANGRSDPHRATNHDKIRSLGGGLLRSLRV